jgi:Mrp family chromosome partitioning ATPase
VDQFFWPPECQALTSHMPREMEDVCRRLADGASGTRKVVAIAGLMRGDGCSTMLLCLARQMARRQERIAIVDGDFRGPALAQRLGLAVESGWQHVLLGELPLRDALVASIDDRLTLLPLAENVSDTEPLAESIQASTSLGMMRTDYDLVLIDVGPILETDSTALKLLRRAGASGALLVHDVRRRNETELLNAARRLASVGVPVLGIAENFAA